MAGFDEAWLAVSGARNGEAVSNRLRPLLEAVYQQALAEPIDSATLKQSLVELLTFLNGEGRSNANCWAADLFFARSENWETDWAERNLPENIHDVFAMMSEALHDTVQRPRLRGILAVFPSNCLNVWGKRLINALTVHVGTKSHFSGFARFSRLHSD